MLEYVCKNFRIASHAASWMLANCLSLVKYSRGWTYVLRDAKNVAKMFRAVRFLQILVNYSMYKGYRYIYFFMYMLLLCVLINLVRVRVGRFYVLVVF